MGMGPDEAEPVMAPTDFDMAPEPALGSAEAAAAAAAAGLPDEAEPVMAPTDFGSGATEPVIGSDAAAAAIDDEADAVGDPHMTRSNGDTADMIPEDLSLSQDDAEQDPFEHALNMVSGKMGMGMGSSRSMGMGMGSMGMGM